MQALFKALGLTIWGLIALGLVAVCIFVGYEAALKFRPAGPPTLTAPPPLAAPGAVPNEPVAAAAASAAAPKPRDEAIVPEAAPLAIVRPLFQRAAEQHHHDRVIEYGQQLIDNGEASADDLVTIAQAYSSIQDCSNARLAMDKAIAADAAVGRAPAAGPRQEILNCRDTPRGIELSHTERFNRLLQALRATAQADRERLPQLEAQAAEALSGNPSVVLGELDYGFGEYAKAVEAIRTGLKKGGVRHLDDAYVYLGLAEQALGHTDEARQAFAQLKEVPGISPRVLKLWTLYAEVRL